MVAPAEEEPRARARRGVGGGDLESQGRSMTAGELAAAIRATAERLPTVPKVPIGQEVQDELRGEVHGTCEPSTPSTWI
jgi:hypothetical protein